MTYYANPKPEHASKFREAEQLEAKIRAAGGKLSIHFTDTEFEFDPDSQGNLFFCLGQTWDDDDGDHDGMFDHFYLDHRAGDLAKQAADHFRRIAKHWTAVADKLDPQ